jgi:hypothetical protein
MPLLDVFYQMSAAIHVLQVGGNTEKLGKDNALFGQQKHAKLMNTIFL